MAVDATSVKHESAGLQHQIISQPNEPDLLIREAQTVVTSQEAQFVAPGVESQWIIPHCHCLSSIELMKNVKDLKISFLHGPGLDVVWSRQSRCCFSEIRRMEDEKHSGVSG